MSLLKTYIVNGDYVWMAKGSGGTSFLLKTPKMVLVICRSRLNEFESNITRKSLVTGAKNLAHATGANFFQNPVMTDDLANHNLQTHLPEAC